MTVNSIPNASHPIAGGQRVDPTWYKWLRELDREARDTGADLSAEIEAIARKLGSPDGTIDGIPESSQNITALPPLAVSGNQITLSTLTAETAGELFGITRDAYGRISALRPVVAGAGITIDGTTDPDEIAIVNSGLANPMTTLGDIITGGTGGTPQRLGIGSAGQVLTVVSGAPAWAPGGGGSVNVQDEGITVVSGASAINFVGAGVTATNGGGGVATVTIPGVSTPSPSPIWEGYAACVPQSNGTAEYGFPSPLVTGSSTTARTTSATDRFSAFPRRAHNLSPASATAIAGVRGGTNPGAAFLLASATTAGCEFEMVLSPGTGATVSSHRLFGGWWANAAAPTDVNPSTLTNIVGLGYDSADTQVQIIHNDASGTATKVALGASFPKPTTAEGSAYYLRLSSTTAGTVDYFVREIISGASTSGTITTDLPTALLNWYSWMSAGGTSTTLSHIWSYTRIKVFG